MNPDADKFSGFAPESLDFLRDNKANNTKGWFEAHRSDYEQHLLSPLRALAASLTPLMLSIDPDLVTTPARVISRIHRDTRFSRDKSPYKSTLWLTFKRPLSDWQDAPAFFFELGADSWRYGMGFYAASKKTMDRLRLLIERKPVEFERMIAFLAEQDRFMVEGEQYKRLINPAVPEHLRPWHQRKSVYLVCNRQSGRLLYDREILNELITGFACCNHSITISANCAFPGCIDSLRGYNNEPETHRHHPIHLPNQGGIAHPGGPSSRAHSTYT